MVPPAFLSLNGAIMWSISGNFRHTSSLLFRLLVHSCICLIHHKLGEFYLKNRFFISNLIFFCLLYSIPLRNDSLAINFENLFKNRFHHFGSGLGSQWNLKGRTVFQYIIYSHSFPVTNISHLSSAFPTTSRSILTHLCSPDSECAAIYSVL